MPHWANVTLDETSLLAAAPQRDEALFDAACFGALTHRKAARMYPVGYAFVYSRETPVPHRSTLLHGQGLRMDGVRTFPSTSFAHGQPLLGLGYDCTDAGMSQTHHRDKVRPLSKS